MIEPMTKRNLGPSRKASLAPPTPEMRRLPRTSDFNFASYAVAGPLIEAGWNVDRAPDEGANPFALALPLFEITCGLLLLWPPTRRVGALAIAVLSVMFFAALLSALLRGLTLDCGCFGTGAPSRPRMWIELGLNILLASGSMLIYLRSTIVSLRRPA